MYHTETLNTLAEISITLVGFSGIVVIFGNRFVRGWTKKEALQFNILLATPLTALFCSFSPKLLSTIIEDPEIVWRLSNAILGILHLANLAYLFTKMTYATTTVSQRLLSVVGISMISAHLLASVNIIPWLEFVFILGLLQQISIGVLNFVLLFKPVNENSIE